MKYTEGYKYRLEEDFHISTKITPEYEFHLKHIKLSSSGILTVCKGYSWDGASGPTLDTKNSMVAALVHDAFYELMRKQCISIDNRPEVDKLFYTLLLKNGMNKIRSWVWYRAVKKCGLFGATDKRKIHEAG